MPYDSASAAQPSNPNISGVINNNRAGFYLDSSTGDTLERIGGTAAWRYNNPGNLQYESAAAAAKAGAIGTVVVNDGGTYYRGIFPSVAAGIAALAVTLTSYAGMTISDALNSYAPPATNDTASYISAVTAQMGVPDSTVLTPANIASFASAIISHEGTVAGMVYTNGQPGDPNEIYDRWDTLRLILLK